MSHGSSVGNDAMPFEHEDNGGQSADIQFDNDGNLHFVSSSPDIPHDIPLQALAHDNADKPDTPNGVSCSKDRLQMELGNSVSAAPGIQDSASHIFMEEDNRSGSYDPGLAFEIALEAAENDIIGRRTNNTAEANVGHVLKRQRLGHRQLIDIGDGSQNGTYEKRVTALWEDTCLWHKAAEPKVIAASNKHVQQQAVWRARIAAQMFATPCIRATEFLFLPGKPENPDATTLAEAGHDHDYPYGFNASSPGIIDGYASDDFLAADDHHMSAVLDVELDLEQRRGASTPAVSEEADYFNLHMDIPWLNPKVFDPLQRRQSAVSGQLSVRAESSPDPAAASRQYIASVHGTPASRVPSLDPPSSDDGLEIRSFELAAQTPDQQIDDNNVFGQGTNTPSMRGLDSFLNISQLADNRSGHADVPDMDQESLSFKRFVLDRMREHSSNKVVFDDLLLPSYRTRRVAARAFVDLLQMASKSVFHASQKQAFATINISML
ncbi:hypothetical protein LPJ66_005524 [Kickxella alabastrina]|uniref:Uncharacterized protein n=1 Tax=Kickxella alabastrina TaxID=61397 RepID=A0ACC1IEX6_9FUNG|nr:hypothetical protein LPJ66_005524 [Kickxella alabastrina]